jgi:hypothetical protein
MCKLPDIVQNQVCENRVGWAHRRRSNSYLQEKSLKLLGQYDLRLAPRGFKNASVQIYNVFQTFLVIKYQGWGRLRSLITIMILITGHGKLLITIIITIIWLFFSDYNYDFNYAPMIFFIMIMIICPLTDRLRFWLQISDYNYDYKNIKKSIHIFISESCSVHMYKDVYLAYNKHINWLTFIVN